VHTSTAYFDPIALMDLLKESQLRSAYLMASRSACSMTYLNCCEIGDACMYHSHGSMFMMSPGNLLHRLTGEPRYEASGLK